jgi:tRNA A-37 threonylcarbamoyl transferase component Bud32
VSRAVSTRYVPGALLGGRYEVLEPLGQGGMAEVYLATDRLLGRQVAVKVILERYAGDDRFVARFRREARAAAALSHPNVVSVFDVGTHQGSPFIVMEYVPGRTLAELLESGPMSPQRVAEIGEAAARALGAAHAAGIVHRDVKPANVMVTADGRIVVLDFGIARALRWTPLTEAAAVHGTAEYMAPEYVRGEGADPRSDLYSLGAVLYELLAGRPPFTGESPLQVAYRHLEEAPASPDSIRPGIPAGLSTVVLRSLAKHPGERYARAEEMAADLHRLRSGQPAATAPVPHDRTGVLHRPPPEPPARADRRGLRWAAVAGVAALVVALLVAIPALWPDPGREGRGGPRRARPPSDVVARSECVGLLQAEVALSWTASRSGFADGYDVYRSTQSGGQFDLIGTVPGPDSTGFVDDDVAMGSRYFYQVRATARRGDSVPVQVQTDTPAVCLF